MDDVADDKTSTSSLNQACEVWGEHRDSTVLPSESQSIQGVSMRGMYNKLVAFLKNEDGPTAVEYAVMLSLIIVVCIAAITTLGSNANQAFSFVGSNIKG
jgi:pilus assembly protein Flp/PilA